MCFTGEFHFICLGSIDTCSRSCLPFLSTGDDNLVSTLVLSSLQNLLYTLFESTIFLIKDILKIYPAYTSIFRLSEITIYDLSITRLTLKASNFFNRLRP